MSLGNSNILPVSVTQQVTSGAVSAQSAALRADTIAITVRSVGFNWIQLGANPVAIATPGANIPIRDGDSFTLKCTGEFKVAVIQDSAAGSIDIYEHPAP